MPRTVVITRPLAQALPLAAQVRALGRAVEILPLLDIAPLPDQAALGATLARLDEYALVAFVSPNAIDAAFAHIDRWPAGVTLAVLGEGSRSALAAHGITPEQVDIVSPHDPARSDSEHLLQTLAATGRLARLRGRRVLIVRGEAGRELMADGLRAAGADVTAVAAYRRSVPALTPALRERLAALLQTPNDWIVTSSEALRGLLQLLAAMAQDDIVAKMQQQQLIVPHARIAATAHELGLHHVTLTGSGDERLLAALQSRP